MENWRDDVKARIAGLEGDALRAAFDDALRFVWVHMERLNADVEIRRVEICVLTGGEMEVTALSKPRPAPLA